MCATSDALSLVCDREATTIEPLVNGQQLIASPCAGDGSVNCVSSLAKDFLEVIDRFKPWCFALQQACEFIAADVDIGCKADCAEASMSPIEARA